MLKYVKKLDIEAINWLKKFLEHTETWSFLKRKVIGSMIFGVGIIFLVTPGPGIVFLAAGGTLISERFGVLVAKVIQKYLKWRGIS